MAKTAAASRYNRSDDPALTTPEGPNRSAIQFTRSPSNTTAGFKSPGTKKNKDIINTRHPEYALFADDWFKFKLTYYGGEEFKKQYLFRFSRAEDMTQFEERMRVSYVPAHAKKVVNLIRNAFARKMPDVTRKGDARYVQWAKKDVDTFQQSMATFMGLETLPLLLAQGKRLIGMDAPPSVPGATAADDDALPNIFTIDADNLLSWTYDEKGRFTAALIREFVDKIDDESGLVCGSEEQFKLMRLVPAVTANPPAEGENAPPPTANQMQMNVLIRIYDKDGKQKGDDAFLQLDEIPLIEMRLVESILTDIADIQIASMQLASSDMAFLFKGNFPLYVEQYKDKTAFIKPTASKRTQENFDQEVSNQDRISTDSNEKEREVGPGTGVGYAQDLDAPSFISPPTENVKISMEKQNAMETEINTLAHFALVSMSIKAVEQSGKSKEADRVDEDAALDSIATVLETGERQIAELWHKFMGMPITQGNIEVNYPTGYTLKTPADRMEQADAIGKMLGAVQSATYNREIQKWIVRTILKQNLTAKEIDTIEKEIDEMTMFDSNELRSKIIQMDVQSGVLSKETGTLLRGYGTEEVAKAQAEALAHTQLLADQLSGGPDNPGQDTLLGGGGDKEDDTMTGGEDTVEGGAGGPPPGIAE